MIVLSIGDYLLRNFTSSDPFIMVWTPSAETENLDPAMREAVQAITALQTPGSAQSDAVTGELFGF